MGDLTLAEFLAARLDEDEAVARRNTGDAGLADDGESGPAWPDYATWTGTDDYAAAGEYIARFRPARMLREVEAKRAIVFACSITGASVSPAPWENDTQAAKLGRETLRRLALIWNDHPDYREEWRP